jgi:hypothetical protein
MSNSNAPNAKIEEYTFEKKKKMATKISNMRNKDYLRKIRDIIFSENPNISAKKDSGGYLMYFQNYTDSTYHKIDKFLNKLDNDKLKRQAKTFTETSDHMLLSSEDPNVDYNVMRTRLRYSNREKRLIKRKQYENIINDNNMINSSGTCADSNENVSDSDDDSAEQTVEPTAKQVRTTKPTSQNALQNIRNVPSDDPSKTSVKTSGKKTTTHTVSDGAINEPHDKKKKELKKTETTIKNKTSEKQPRAPEKQPRAPEKQPRAPEKQPRAPEKQPRAPEKQPRVPEKQLRAPEKQPRAPEKQPRVPEKQPRAPEKQPRAPENQLRAKRANKNSTNLLDSSVIFSKMR